MHITTAGALLIPFAMYLFFFGPRLLYPTTVFFIPFSATAVANVGWGGGEKGIPVWMFVGTLWIIRTCVSSKPFWHLAGWHQIKRKRLELLALVACGFISLCVPLMVNGTGWIEYYRIYSNQTIPLRLDATRITQTAYFAFGVVFTILVAVENLHPGRLAQSIKAYTAAAVFASLWAFIQLWCILTGHKYPAFLFNNSMGTSARLYSEQITGTDLHRVSSVAVEPAQFAFSLLLAFIFLFIAVGFHRPIFSRKWDIVMVLLVTAALISSTATTAYAGLFLASCLAIMVLARAGKIRWLYVGLTAGVASLGIIIALSFPMVRQLIEIVVVNKAGTYSGLERIHSMALGARYFFQYPVLGTSWNAVSSSDLVLQFLSSLGVVGFIALVIFLADELRGLWRASASGSYWSVSLLAGVSLMLVLSQAVGFPFAMGYVWFALGLGAAAPLAVSSQQTTSRQRQIPNARTVQLATARASISPR